MNGKRGANLTKAEREDRWATVHGWRLAGVTFPEIAARLGLACGTVEEWYRQQRDKRMHEQVRALRPARCLRCWGTFQSEGAHNRMCDECRASPASPLAPNPGGHTGRRAGRPR